MEANLTGGSTKVAGTVECGIGVTFAGTPAITPGQGSDTGKEIPAFVPFQGLLCHDIFT